MESKKRKRSSTTSGELAKVLGNLEARLGLLLNNLTAREIWFRPSASDRLRLLNLRTWALRYRLSLKSVLSLLLNHYRPALEKAARRKSSSLGIRISTLCGEASRIALEDYLIRECPDQENLEVWKEQLLRPLLRMYSTWASTDVAQYEKRTIEVRKRRELLEAKLAKQPWRGNPWR